MTKARPLQKEIFDPSWSQSQLGMSGWDRVALSNDVLTTHVGPVEKRKQILTPFHHVFELQYSTLRCPKA